MAPPRGIPDAEFRCVDLGPELAVWIQGIGEGERMTALRWQCLLVARVAFGAGFVAADARNEALAKDVLFWVMRHSFHSSDPKGVFCCPACTLSLLPLYAGSWFRWVQVAARFGRS